MFRRSEKALKTGEQILLKVSNQPFECLGVFVQHYNSNEFMREDLKFKHVDVHKRLLVLASLLTFLVGTSL